MGASMCFNTGAYFFGQCQGLIINPLYALPFSDRYFSLYLLLLGHQSIASVKGGLVWTDIFDDGQLLAQHQKGYTLGFEVRLVAQDPTYFLLGAFLYRDRHQPESYGRSLCCEKRI